MLPAPRRLMILAPRYLPRIAATVGLFTRYGLLDFAKRQGLTSIEGVGTTDGQPGAGKDTAEANDKAVAFRERLVELGPAYVKLGQVLSKIGRASCRERGEMSGVG